MSCNVPEYEIGNTADLRSDLEDENGSFVSPDVSDSQYEIYITIEHVYSGDVVVDEERMEYVTAQEFRYPWDTTGVELGEYSVEVKAFSGGEVYQNRERVKVVEFSERPETLV